MWTNFTSVEFIYTHPIFYLLLMSLNMSYLYCSTEDIQETEKSHKPEKSPLRYLRFSRNGIPLCLRIIKKWGMPFSSEVRLQVGRSAGKGAPMGFERIPGRDHTTPWRYVP